MIPALGAGGPGFKPRNGPLLFRCHTLEFGFDSSVKHTIIRWNSGMLYRKFYPSVPLTTWIVVVTFWMCPFGLVVWFLLRVQEVPGSNPGMDHFWSGATHWSWSLIPRWSTLQSTEILVWFLLQCTCICVKAWQICYRQPYHHPTITQVVWVEAMDPMVRLPKGVSMKTILDCVTLI